ncbi:iron uptake transporter deferrochelatase/peroxidase subunit [Tsukamurella sp. 8F]|uniref:iron uptake transporter deferrochelatase/peroxidase subunit n=1 Tax=unclassified Tsukamurella TaxID=2633480 RepID=UPI0023B90BA8|nr:MULTISPECIES: iron uptake transporter deferrochelatase/peroxidase subunit [unclassified Tsukamurella]MDF0530082.1 iron uptake transporter deferrochelatase/peroxidase subunit [Tsukamurella sp. 8J]MDF0586400.1 iron uptake transporter deferrochelatase/peroxidase subunit [Tsukamurella sp. 8F]
MSRSDTPPDSPADDGSGAPDAPAPAGRRFGRRGFLSAAGLTGAGVVAGAVAGGGVAYAVSTDRSDPGTETVPFYGDHQAGVVTPQQNSLVFAAFDVNDGVDVTRLQATLARWAAAASLMTEGKTVGPVETRAGSPPADTGEAYDLGAHRLTITVGFGTTLFDSRFGLADKMPAALKPLGQLAVDTSIDPAISGGDLCVQACAEDPQVAFHAVRNMARIGRGVVTIRWLQEGFGRASATSTSQVTPRNLLGFKDGTANIKAEDPGVADSQVWVGDETDQPWMKGGSYLVARKIRMHVEAWDSDDITDQERIFGRVKDSGAPLSGGSEFTALDFAKKGSDGATLINRRSHVKLAHPDNNGGAQILRRGYNYTDGMDTRTGTLAAGLFFIAYQKDAHKQFARIQNSLAEDGLNEYITPISSSLFAVPPGLKKIGDWYGKEMFGYRG